MQIDQTSGNPGRHAHERKGAACPVEQLNFDIMSIIFVMCGEADWTAPIRLSSVSRSWRACILDVPRAWATINLNNDSQNANVVKMYFERSAPCLLHLGLHPIYPGYGIY